MFFVSINIGKYACLIMFEPNFMDNIVIHNKDFEIYLSEDQLQTKVRELAEIINNDFKDDNPVIIAVLNGSFVFAADFVRNLNIPHTIEFIKVSSFTGTTSSGNIKNLIGLNTDIKGKKVILLEDIVNTGLTIQAVIESIQLLQPANIDECHLLFKPQMLKTNIKINYVGYHLPNKFVVGYGLDFNGYGRNLRHLYAAKGA